MNLNCTEKFKHAIDGKCIAMSMKASIAASASTSSLLLITHQSLHQLQHQTQFQYDINFHIYRIIMQSCPCVSILVHVCLPYLFIQKPVFRIFFSASNVRLVYFIDTVFLKNSSQVCCKLTFFICWLQYGSKILEVQWCCALSYSTHLKDDDLKINPFL